MSEKQYSIPICKHDWGHKEIEAIAKAASTGWITGGPAVTRFEKDVSQYLGIKHAVAVNSGTAALTAALLALNVQTGDEIIVPSFTFVATANAVEHVGAKVVFCDVQKDTFNVSPADLKRKITEKTKLIIPVHLFGLCADMDAILKIAGDIPVVEDACCALGAYYKSNLAGTMGIAGCFSFHPRKVITTGEGGMLVTNSDRIASVTRQLREHGAVEHPDPINATVTPPDFTMPGFNWKMPDILAAAGVEQLGRIYELIEARRRVAAWYAEHLSPVDDMLHLPVTPSEQTHIYQSYVVVLREEYADAVYRNNIARQMNDLGIAVKQAAHHIPDFSYYREKYSNTDCIVSRSLAHNTLSLPIFPQMKKSEVKKVAECLKNLLRGRM